MKDRSMAISSYGAVSCLSVVEGSVIRLDYFSVRWAYYMVASTPLSHRASTPLSHQTLLSHHSAPSAFIYIVSRRLRRLFYGSETCFDKLTNKFDRLTNQAQQPCFDRLSNHLEECTLTSHELPAMSQTPLLILVKISDYEKGFIILAVAFFCILLIFCSWINR
jgi:hypothetical protein